MRCLIASGFKSGGRDFQKGKPGGPGRPRLPEDVKQIRKLGAAEFVRAVNKYIWMTKEQIDQAQQDPGISQFDLAVISLVKLSARGDIVRFEALLSRFVPKILSPEGEDASDGASHAEDRSAEEYKRAIELLRAARGIK